MPAVVQIYSMLVRVYPLREIQQSTVATLEMDGREGPPHSARQIPLPTALRELLTYMCCDVCALLLGGFRHHTPAGGIRHFRDAGASHPGAFGACKLLGPASLFIAALLPGFAARLPPSSPRIRMFGCQLMFGACRSRGGENRAYSADIA